MKNLSWKTLKSKDLIYFACCNNAILLHFEKCKQKKGGIDKKSIPPAQTKV